LKGFFRLAHHTKSRLSVHVGENTLGFVTYYIKHRRFTTATEEKFSDYTLLVDIVKNFEFAI
jgi:hypothetical protein